jgi:predicted aminopeptidase
MKPIETCFLIAILSLLAACNEMQYYAQSVQGQLDILSQTQDIELLLADDKLDEEVRGKLLLVLQARKFAGDALDLSFNKSYTEYADLNRSYVVKNLYAAEEFSTQLYSWCYPVIGCANYRGYFDTPMLERYRGDMDETGYDTYVGNVTAYSTLGWFDDPVLNTFVGLPDYRLAGLVFHELAHQQIYTNGDTAFNESFATTVEQAGLEQFYAAGDDANQLGNYRLYRKRMSELVTLAAQAREELESLYRLPLSDVNKRQDKARVIEQLEYQYAALTKSWTGSTYAASSPVFNNARLGAMAAYHQYVPAFLNILLSHNQSFPQFYSHVRKLSELAPEKREQCLLLWDETARIVSTPMPAMCEA